MHVFNARLKKKGTRERRESERKRARERQEIEGEQEKEAMVYERSRGLEEGRIAVLFRHAIIALKRGRS
jgi:hypothetical protein